MSELKIVRIAYMFFSVMIWLIWAIMRVFKIPSPISNLLLLYTLPGLVTAVYWKIGFWSPKVADD